MYNIKQLKVLYLIYRIYMATKRCDVPRKSNVKITKLETILQFNRMACMNAMSRQPVFRVKKIIKNERLNGISQSALIVLVLLLKGRCKTYFNK